MAMNIFISACHEANADQPFMCLDLTFIWVLLEKGFALNENTRINVSYLRDIYVS